MRQSEVVYQELRERILDWRLAPGTVLGEAELSNQLGVSRTPVREALPRLEREGLVRITPRRGAVVTDVSINSVSQLFQMREALETYAARLAARHGDLEVFDELQVELRAVKERLEAVNAGTPADDQLHQEHRRLIDRFDSAVEEATKNPYLQASLREIQGHVARLRRLAQSNPDRIRQAADEHLSICLAICARDETLAAQATAVHIHNSLRNILSALVQDVTASVLVTSGDGGTDILGVIDAQQ